MSEVVLYRNISLGKMPMMNYKALKGVKETVMLYDATNKDPFDSAFNFTLNDYKKFPLLSEAKMNFFFNEVLRWKHFNNVQRQMWFNAGYSVLLYFLKNPDYDYYWSIEYDCWFNGNWSDFFKLYEKEKADFLGPHLIETTNSDSILEQNKLIKNFDYPKLFNSFGCIHRYSNALLQEVIKALKEKRQAFYETLFPTIAFNNDLKIRDLNDVTANPVYTESSLLRLNMTPYELIHVAKGKNKLWHRVR